jgi:hypothetical protein
VQEIALDGVVAVEAPEVAVLELGLVVLVEFANGQLRRLVLVAVFTRKVLVVYGRLRLEYRLYVGLERAARIRSRSVVEEWQAL